MSTESSFPIVEANSRSEALELLYSLAHETFNERQHELVLDEQTGVWYIYPIGTGQQLIDACCALGDGPIGKFADKIIAEDEHERGQQ